MSTRSGKRIHISFHENTMKSEPDITRSERKTRSKHTKENLDELNVSPKLKKRNYVAYPGSADDESGVDTVDCKDEGRAASVLRKNALKERNFTSSMESVESTMDTKLSADTRKSVRSTRRTRKFAENTEDNLEVIPQNGESSKVCLSKLPKPKKEKKKKKAEQDQVTEIEVTVPKKKKTVITEVMVVPKKKSKKKKGRRSSSIVVEDIEPEAPSGLNKSNMSVDSFHSAAGSPRNINNYNEPAPLLQNNIEAEFNINTSIEYSDINKTEARKTRSSMKLGSTLNNDDIVEKEPRKRKSSVKVNLNLEEATFENDKALNRELRKNKTSINNEAIPSSELIEEGHGKNSTFNVEEKLNSSLRKSIRNATFDKTVTPNKIDSTFDKDDTEVTSAKGKKNKQIVDTFDVNEDLKSTVEENSMNATFEKDAVTESSHKGKKRKSALIKTIDKLSPLNSTSKVSKKKSVIDNISEKPLEIDVSKDKEKSIIEATFECVNSSFKASPMNLFMEEPKKSVNDTTFEKKSEPSSDLDTEGHKKSTFDLTSSPFKSAHEVSSPMTMIDDLNHKSVVNTTYEKHSDKDQVTKKRKSSGTNKDSSTILEMPQSSGADSEINSTFDIDQEKKLDTTFDKNSKSSLLSSDSSMITLDKSNASRISITSDESKNEENILNSTPVLVESSLDESQINTTKTKETTPLKTDIVAPITPLKREGTFTKDEPEIISSSKPKGSSSSSLSRTPTKRLSLPSPGFTPFHVNKSSSKESVLFNVTRSIEKRQSSLVEPPRTTKVMFCSPVNNPTVLTQIKRKVIKSNLKGSNKSFVFDESVSVVTRPSSRKRSYTQSDAEDGRMKRKRLADDLQQSVDRLSRPRTSSASAKLAEPTTPSKRPTTPKKSDAKVPRTKLPNFAALHQKQFNKMESLDECQERRAKRAKQLLTPTGAVNVLERISPKDKLAEPEKPREPPKKPETPIKSLPTFKSLNPGYTRFGFKLNLDVNPFSIPSKTQPKTKETKPNGLTKQATLPSLAGATSLRRAVAKQTVMREKSFTDRRSVKRTENRTVIKGVRTNRRFELQMRMRDI